METVHFLLLKAWVGWRLLSDPHPAHHSCFGDCGGIDRECVWGVGRECLWGCWQTMPVGVLTENVCEGLEKIPLGMLQRMPVGMLQRMSVGVLAEDACRGAGRECLWGC